MSRNHSIMIEKGATFRLTVNVTDSGVIKNLTGYSARMHIRATPNILSILLDASTYITINNPTQGQLTIGIPATITSAITWTKGVYDLEVYTAADADVIRVLQGEIAATPEVTR